MRKSFNIPLNHSRHSSGGEVPNQSRTPIPFSNIVSNSLTDRVYSTIDNTERTSASLFQAPRHQIKRPISLTVLEKYFSDICQCINSKNCIDPGLINRVDVMKDVLKDCLNAVSDLSLEIYILMNSALKDLETFQQNSDRRIFSILMSKLIQINILIEDDKFISKTEPAVHGWGQNENAQEDLKTELDVRISRITARILNVWKKIVSPQKEAGIICCCFLLLYCEIDRTIKVSPVFRVKYDKAVNLMKDYSANPGYVVTVIRKTKEYIENERISLEVMRRIHDSLQKITPDSIKEMDKTFTGFAIYELILYSTKYYQQCYQNAHNIDIFSKDYQDSKASDIKPTDKSLNISHTDLFPNSHTTESPKKSKITPRLNPKFSKLSFHSPSTKAFSQSPEKILTARSSLKPTPSKLTPSQVKASIISKSPIRSIKSGISPQKSEKTIAKPTRRPEFFKAKEKKVSIITASPAKSRVEKPGLTGETADFSQILEELQYQQFIEEKFRKFLVDKLESEAKVKGVELSENIEEKVIVNREKWMKEFENSVRIIRFNAMRKLGDDNRFSSELLRAQKQLEIIGNTSK